MLEKKPFNPIECAREIENSYREYIATTIHFDNPELQQQLKKILKRPRYLAKGPYLQATPPYKKGKTVTQLVNEGLLCRSMLKLGDGDPDAFDPNRPLYTHQVKAIEKANKGRNYAVVTGTGSGKTECFLLPILNDILTEFEEHGPSSGVRAMILYPMNALANDQLKRLRSLLKGTNITFGRYTGDTEEHENSGQNHLDNEIISREEIRRNPPNILLTNYSMLEYLLLRPSDSPLFGKAFGSEWRHIAIDEAHVYSGTLGTEISYLLRRLKARIETETERSLHLHCYATSATIGSNDDMPNVADFAADLFGEPFSNDPNDLDVITSDQDDPVQALDEHPWGSLSLQTWPKLRQLLGETAAPNADTLRETLAEGGAPVEILDHMDSRNPLEGLGAVLLGECSTAKLVKRCKNLLDLTDISEIENFEIEGLFGDQSGIDTLAAMVEVLSHAQRSNGVPVLSSRYHSFLRAPEGLFINLNDMRLMPEKKTSEPYPGSADLIPVYEISVCRHCGQAYILGNEERDPQTSLHWLNPRHEGTDADDEFVPRKYYRVLQSLDERDEDEKVMWLCPTCGTMHIEREGGAHRFNHRDIERIPIALNEVEGKQADERTARCRHCGYQSAVAIQPMRVSPEAAGSVVCYDLVRNVPPFDNKAALNERDPFSKSQANNGGSIICFSDKRQDAAFFAPAMKRTYNAITRRQAIYDAIRTTGESGCSFSRIVNWLSREGAKKYERLFKTKQHNDRKIEAEAWLLDELATEDSRNSLEGLGVIRIEPTYFLEMLSTDDVEGAVEKTIGDLGPESFSWLSRNRFKSLLRLCIELMRSSNVTYGTEATVDYRNNSEKHANALVRSKDVAEAAKHYKVFVGSSSGTEGKYRAIVKKLVRSYGKELSKEEATALLDALFTFIGFYLKWLNLLSDNEKNPENGFMLSQDLWTFYPSHPDDTVYLCDTCGCMTHADTETICLTSKCDGVLHKMSLSQAKDKDLYYKTVYRDHALPIRIEEHTAQLSSETAREIQSDFINGKVNVLSCTTTFELGVDVGDLRVIFMRNVPPSAANYAQRAGRVGRRAGMPGYAVTFARLRPHDIAFFSNPEKIIAGKSPVPSVYRDNEAIAIRHIFAIALSSYFRHSYAMTGVDCTKQYDTFLSLAQERPEGLEQLARYLSSHPHDALEQVERVLPPSLANSEEMKVSSWAWIKHLLNKESEAGPDKEGRLLQLHSLKHTDFERLQNGIEQYGGNNPWREFTLKSQQKMLGKTSTIQVLAEGGVLPKYGFPTDLVELHLPKINSDDGNGPLSLQRGMRQAIREYAPGAEIVAGGKLWKSSGIRKPNGRQLMIRRYGECQSCGTFVWPIDNFTDEAECPTCKQTVRLKKKMLIPSYGFERREIRKGVGLRRPRSMGYATVYFSQLWNGEIKEDDIELPGGLLSTRYAGNGQLCILNEPKSGFQVCKSCYAAAATASDIQHWAWCKDKSKHNPPDHYEALGSSFTTDVLELTLSCDALVAETDESWESLMWSLLAASSQILGIPETELGGTYYRNKGRGMSIMLYDNVPGGAGHALRLRENLNDILTKALEIVSNCTCSEDTCCYGCIASYYNQARQAVLSRGAAKRMLEALLRPSAGPSTHPDGSILAREHNHGAKCSTSLHVLFDSVPLGDCTFSEACLYALNECVDENERRFVQKLSDLGTNLDIERPMMDVTCAFSDSSEAGAMLAWKKARLLLLNANDKQEFIDAVGTVFRDIAGWSIYIAGEDQAETIIDALKRMKG